MIKNWVISMVISFIMRQLAKWQLQIDWAKVKADLQARVAALIRGEWLDAEAVELVGAMVDAASSVLAASEELEKIVKLLADQKFQEAWEALRALILGQWVPSSPVQEKAKKCIEACEVL